MSQPKTMSMPEMAALAEFRLIEAAAKEIRARREGMETALVDGRAKDFADYRYMVGERGGLLRAEETILGVVRKLRDGSQEGDTDE